MAAPGSLVGNGGGPYKTTDGVPGVHVVNIHKVPVNELFHKHTGVSTTIAVDVAAQQRNIIVADGSLIADGAILQLENGVIETTFPTVIGGGGTNTLTLDRPLDNAFSVGDSVEVITTNMAVDGSITPVAFRLIPDKDQVWHIVRFLLGMVHNSAADDSTFGSIPALLRGCTLRAYSAALGQYRTFTNWKANSDIKMDMFDVVYTDKAGGGDFGTNSRGSVEIGTGASPTIDGAAGDYLELLIQDDLTAGGELILFQLKGQGNIEGM